MLDITNFGSLYDAWSSLSVEEIEDFNCKEVAESFFQETPTGENPPAGKTKCVKENWISELPKVLLFTINRVNYNIKSRKLIKNNKRFDFEKLLYADKFLMENRSKDEEINRQISSLRDKQKQYREQLKQYKEYHKGLSIQEIIQVAQTFIEDQCEDFEDINQNEDVVMSTGVSS